jgi:hypothetical protein
VRVREDVYGVRRHVVQGRTDARKEGLGEEQLPDLRWVMNQLRWGHIYWARTVEQ